MKKSRLRQLLSRKMRSTIKLLLGPSRHDKTTSNPPPRICATQDPPLLAGPKSPSSHREVSARRRPGALFVCVMLVFCFNMANKWKFNFI